MRRLYVYLALISACVLCAGVLVLTSMSSPREAQVGSPNFICIAMPHFGLCVGPPTTPG